MQALRSWLLRMYFAQTQGMLGGASTHAKSDGMSTSSRDRFLASKNYLVRPAVLPARQLFLPAASKMQPASRKSEKNGNVLWAKMEE